MPQRATSGPDKAPKARRQQAAATEHDDRLIRWMLNLPPIRRLEVLQDFVDGVTALRHARKITQ